MIDIFSTDAFSITTLSDAIRELKVRPGRLDHIGLFEASSVNTLSVAIERIGDAIRVVAPSPRGAPGETVGDPKRTVEDLPVPHFQRDWSVLADEVQNVREFGRAMALQTVQGKVAEKISRNVADLDITEEHARIGAIQGIVTYKGGQTLNLFERFGISPPAEIDFDLDNATPADGILRKRCTAIIRAVRAVVGGQPFSHVHAFVGDNFFDDLLQHKEVRDTYKGWSEAQILRDSYLGRNADPKAGQTFVFGDIVFENYGVTTADDGTAIGIAADKAKFVPVGAAGLFRSYYAPADYNETVNRFGQRLYAKQWPFANGKGVHGETQMNALSICTRPAALFSAKRT